MHCIIIDICFKMTIINIDLYYKAKERIDTYNQLVGDYWQNMSYHQSFINSKIFYISSEHFISQEA